MTLEYTLQESDYLTYLLYTATKSERIKKQRWRARLFMALSLTMLAAVNFLIYKFDLAIIFLVAGISWFFLYPLWDKKRYINHYNRFIRESYRHRIGLPLTLELGRDQITTRDSQSSTTVKSSEISEINEITDLLMIRLKTSVSFIIPKSKIIALPELKQYLKEMAAELNIKYSTDDQWEWK